MHSIVRKYIKAGFVFLCAGLLLGLYLTLAEYGADLPVSPLLVTAHTHLLLVGFVMMMILGVAQWMFPRPPKGDSGYHPAVAVIVFYSLTAGIILRTSGEIISGFSGSGPLRSVIVAGSVVEVAAMVVFFFNIWSRIRPLGSHLREARGEKF